MAVFKIDFELDVSVVFLMTTYKALQLKQTDKLVFDHWTYQKTNLIKSK